MFDVGFTELFLLALIGLLVLGPERLPGVARTIGGYVRKARASWISLRNTIEAELAEADISAPIKKTGEELKQIGRDLADVPGFTRENRESLKPESQPQSGADADQKSEPVADPDADADADQKSEPVQDSNDRKDENA